MITFEDLSAGLTLNGYRLIRLLGEGGAGSVFKASQTSTGQIVALKMLHQSEDADEGRSRRQIERFDREARLCAQLHHPHIVRLLDKGQTDSNRLFAVFEFVPGETLKDLLLRKGALSAPAAGELMGQVLDALACAHAQGIAHRDLKPQNIMVTATGTRPHVKVLDFGIATFIPDRHKVDFRSLTITQETMCSPSYSAPEQLRGEPPTVKSDLYAWGLLFIECITGKPAIHGLTLAEIYHKQLSAMDVPIPPALFGHPLADLLRRVLRKNPAERAERAAALYEDFQRINLANIVGDLNQHLTSAVDLHPADKAMYAMTQEYMPGWLGQSYERQQITVLCCSLMVTALPETESEIEALEALQRDQLSLCIDTAARYGGHFAGSLGTKLLFYYGHPYATDNDARRSARTALELIGQARRRSPLLEQQQGFKLDIRIGIHTGIVMARQGYLPTGVTPNTALQLERLASPGQVLVSAISRRMLDQFLEFEEAARSTIGANGDELPYFLLVGEHSAEAISFLRSATAGRSLVGRDREILLLSRAWDFAKKRRGHATLIQGEAGIGKSRIAHELCMAVRKEGYATKECRCLPEHQNNALRPILEMLKVHLRLHEASDPESAALLLQAALESSGSELEWIFPILCSWLALPVPENIPPIQLSADRQKQILLDTLQNLILNIGKEQPFLLVIEDVHWIDQSSFDLLVQIAQAVPDHAALIVMTARPDFASPWNDESVELIPVERLSDQHAEQLIGKILGGKAIDPASLRSLCERTDGIPLFVEELMRMLLDSGLLAERHGVYQLDKHFDACDIPVNLRDLLSARLSRLGSARETAQLAATIGREFEFALLVEVAMVDEGTVQSDLDQLIAADLVYRKRRIQGDSYIFRHALIRDAAYDALPRAAKKLTHARIAHHLETRSPAEVERNLSEIAHHFALAAQFEEAVKFGTRSALVSLERALHDDAIALAESAQAWITELPDDQRRHAEIDINQILTNALMSKYGWADARVKEKAEQALVLVEGMDDVQKTVPTLWAMAVYHHVASDRNHVRTLADQLIALSEKSNDNSLSVACITVRGMGYWIDGEYLKATQAFDQVLRNYDSVHHADHGYRFGLDSRIWAMAGLANVQWFADTDDAAAFARAREAVAHARTLDHIPSLGVALMYLAFMHHYADDRDGARAISSQLLALSKKYGLPAVEGYAAIVQCWSTSNLALADQILSGLKNIGCMLGFSYISSLPAEIEARAGNHAEALQRIDVCRLLCDEIDEPYYKPELLRRSADYRAKTLYADHILSRQDLIRAVSLANASGMKRTVQVATAELNALSITRHQKPQQAIFEISST